MKTKVIKLVLGNLLVLLALLLIVEVALRMFNTGYGSAPLDPDPVFHHVHPVNYRFTNYSSTGDFGGCEVYFDGKGLIQPPGRKPVGLRQSSIVFLGDSFVEASQVSYDTSFVGRLQASFPDIEMLNYGVSSYSPVLYYLVAKFKILLQEQLPSKAFIMLYSNDVWDDKNYLENGVFDESQDLIAVNGGEPNFVVSTMRKSYLVRLIRRSQITLKYAVQETPSASAGVVGNYLEDNPDWEETASATYTLKLVRLLESNGIKTYVTAVPSKYNHFFEDYTQEEFSGKVEKWAGQNGVRFIDLIAPFREWRNRHDGSLFFYKDIHFNAEGHRIIADVLGEYVNQE